MFTLLTSKGETSPYPLIFLNENDPLPKEDCPEEDCPICVSAEQWLSDKTTFQKWGKDVGLLLQGDSQIEPLLPDMKTFPMIVIVFPSFKDGRGYSLARLLREHHGYPHKILAYGDILQDQIVFMMRCGFDGLILPKTLDPAPLCQALRNPISVSFQPTGSRDWVVRQRHQIAKKPQSSSP